MRFPFRIAIAFGLTVVATSSRAVAQLPAPPAVAPAIDSVKLQLIRDVLAKSHAIDLMIQTIEAAAPAQRAANPGIPAEFWDHFLAAVHERKGELEALLFPVYDRHFTADELRQLLAFYGSPIGQRMLAEQPAIAREAMASGRQWGQQLGMEIGQKMAAEAQKAP